MISAKQMKAYVIVAITVALASGLVLANFTPRQNRRAVNPPGTESGLPFSNGIVAGNTLYVAGQQGLDNGKLRPGGIGPETQATLENIRNIVTAAGYSMQDVAAVNVYLADIKEFGDMNKVYKTFFPDPKPTRTTVQVAGMVNGARVEISCIAVKSSK
jgi:2-iminobutanoate/2-iminopropanoate deaminase